jgi:hypothetical protein
LSGNPDVVILEPKINPSASEHPRKRHGLDKQPSQGRWIHFMGYDMWEKGRMTRAWKGGRRKGKDWSLCTNPGTKVEPQQIVAQGLLSCVQYPVLVKSSTEDLSQPTFCIALK